MALIARQSGNAGSGAGLFVVTFGKPRLGRGELQQSHGFKITTRRTGCLACRFFASTRSDPRPVQDRLPDARRRASIRARGARSGSLEREPPSFRQGAGSIFARNVSPRRGERKAWSLREEVTTPRPFPRCGRPLRRATSRRLRRTGGSR